MKGFSRSGPSIRLPGVLLSMLLCALPTAGVVSAVAGAARTQQTPELVSLAELHEAPAEHVGRWVRVHFQFESELADWNPYLTRFGRGDYRAFKAWGDEQFLWEPSSWEDPLAVLFARRGGAAEAQLAKLPRLARCEAVVRVRQVFLDRPWIEVASVEPLAVSIQEGTILHAARGLRSMQARRWSMALEDLDRALVGPMPEAARAELRRLRERALARGRTPDESNP